MQWVNAKNLINPEFRSHSGCDPPSLLDIIQEHGMVGRLLSQAWGKMQTWDQKDSYHAMAYLMPSLYCSRLLWTVLGWGHRGMRCAHLIDSCARIIWKTWPPKPVVPKHACSLGKQPAARLWWGFPAAAGSSPSHHRSWERGGSACPGRWAPIAPQAMPAGCWKEWQYEDFFIIHHNMVIAQKASE